MAAAGLQRHGVRALLFDRIVRRESGSEGSRPAEPRDLYDADALRDSIGEQLGWLLNTRVPVDYPTLDARTRARARSTVDYGLPDLTVYPIGDHAARVRLHQHLAETIALYEPRLRDPRVALAPVDGRGDTLAAEVTGTMQLGAIEAPITFRFRIDVEKGAGHGG